MRQQVNRYTVDELCEEAKAYLKYQRVTHPEKTVRTDQIKTKIFLDWLEKESQASGGS